MRWVTALAAVLTLAAGRLDRAGSVSIDVHDAALVDVLTLLGVETETNIVADSSVKDRRVTIRLEKVTLDQALAVLNASQSLATHRIGGVIIVGTAESMSRRYDDGKPGNGTDTAVLALSGGSVTDAIKEFTTALPAGTTVIADATGHRILVSGSAEAVKRARRLLSAIQMAPLDAPPDAFDVYHLKYARATEVVAALKTAFPDTLVVADDAQNAVLAKTAGKLQTGVGAFIRQMDVPSAQVLFEVRVADVRPLNEQSDVGILLGGYDLSGQAVAGAATYAFARNSLAINARLNALITSGHAQILATPKLLTLNNHEADLLIGDTYPVTYFDTRVGGQQVQFVDIGVKLRLTPTIGADGSVTAEMHPEYSAIEGFVGGYPVLTSRKVDSKLRVNDGETIVLGGLIRDIDSESLTRVPGLSSIPILGKIFQDRQRTHQRDEVVFLITPHVVTAYKKP